MRKKVFSVLIALFVLFSVVPATILASGDNSGSDIDNAYPVSDIDALMTALGDPAIPFIEVVAPVSNVEDIFVPDGKTLILRDVGEDPTVMCYPESSFTVDAGATLIIEGSLVASYSATPLGIGGTVINRGRITQSSIYIYPDATLVNDTTGTITERCFIVMLEATFTNNGTLLCPVRYDNTLEDMPDITGVPADQIAPVDFAYGFEELTYTGLALEESVSQTVGLPDDGSEVLFLSGFTSISTLRVRPMGFIAFAIGYTFELDELQSIVVQSKNEFAPRYFLLDSGFNIISTSQNGVLHYTTEPGGTFYLVVCGLNAYDTGSFTITMFEADIPGSESIQIDETTPSFSEGGLSWDEISQTLTLNGIALTRSIFLPDGATVLLAEGSDNFLSGDNSVSSFPPPCLMSTGDLLITGSGNLTINNDYSFGIMSLGTLTINATGTVSVSSALCSLLGLAGIVIDGCPNLISVSSFNPDLVESPFSYGMTGIYSESSIRITDSNVFAYGTAFAISTGNSSPLLAARSSGNSSQLLGVDVPSTGGDITIENSEVYAYCDEMINGTYGYAEVNRGAAIYAGDFLSPTAEEGHARIILTGCDVSSPDGGRIVDFVQPDFACQTITVFPDIDVASKWSQAAKIVRILPTYQVLYDGNGGTGTLADPLNSYWGGETVTVLDNGFTRSGFIFDSWNTAADGSGTSYDPDDTFGVIAGVTLFAQWTPVYTVSFTDWNGNVLSTQAIVSGEAATAPTAPTREGYNFIGWSVTFSSVTSNLTVTALYEAVPTGTPTPTPTPIPSGTPTPDPTATPEPTAAPTPTPTPTPPGGVTRTGEISSPNIPALILLGTGIAAAVVLSVLKKKGIFGS